jgi:hypothetical protein
LWVLSRDPLRSPERSSFLTIGSGIKRFLRNFFRSVNDRCWRSRFRNINGDISTPPPLIAGDRDGTGRSKRGVATCGRRSLLRGQEILGVRQRKRTIVRHSVVKNGDSRGAKQIRPQQIEITLIGVVGRRDSGEGIVIDHMVLRRNRACT